MMTKYFGVILLASATLAAQDFITGQAARAVFGQQTFTAQDQDAQTGPVCGSQVCTPTPYILGASGGIAYANNMLFVADSNRLQAIPNYNRVLIYTNISALLPSPEKPVPTPPTSNFVRCPLCLGTALYNWQTLVLGGVPPNPTTTPDYTDYGTNPTSFRTPTAVATDGKILAVADTDNNRVLIWNSIPASNAQPADIELGQKDFTSVAFPTVDNKSFRGPQGVWIQGSRFFVADTGNNRVMVWNSIPTSNDQPADYVLGVANFSVAPPEMLSPTQATANASVMSSPVTVTSDGQRLFVADLGNNRVMVWNSIPTQNNQPADVAIGQPDLNSNADNNTSVLCPSTGTDSSGKAEYPDRCAATLSSPRFVLSDGQRLYIADGGNDRILVYNTMPTQSGQRCDEVLGQTDEFSDNTTDSTDTFRPDANITRSSSDTIRTPMSLAWDGINLYAADAYDRRILVYTPGQYLIGLDGIVNAASMHVYAVGAVDITGTITAGDQATITIGTQDAYGNSLTSVDYTYTIVTADTIATITTALTNLINAGPDPNVIAVPNTAIGEIVLTARAPGANGNNITLGITTVGAGSTSTTANAATIVLTESSTTLFGGASAAEIAPGTLVTIFPLSGETLGEQTDQADPNAGSWPTTLGGVQVYFNGMAVPLSYVSPKQINVQMPYEVLDTSSVSAYVRVMHTDGSVTYTTAINIPVVTENPGIFAKPGDEPRAVIAYHASSYAVAVVDLEGVLQVGDTATITIDGRNYSYAIQSTDTSLDNVRDALVALIHANPNEVVTASAAGQFDRVILTAKIPGPEGNGITVGASQSSTVSSGATIVLTALQTATCCASVAGSPVTQDNPATPGELIAIYTTGLGVIQPDAAKNQATTGAVYEGPALNSPTAPVDNAQVGGKTANVLFSGLLPGTIGVYKVIMQLDPTLPTNPSTQMYIAQDVFTSNIVTIPIVAATPPTQ